MRNFIAVALAIAFLSYVVTKPSVPPTAPTALAELPTPTTKLADSKASLDPLRAASAGSAGTADPSRAQQPAQPRATPIAPVPSQQPKTKRATEILTAAAIAALIIEESRRLYHARGRPCACPDDLMRNGQACGGRSAYSRPGGAAPLCYPTDVTQEMIRDFRARRVVAQQ
jgi:hypothetical protein